MRILLPTTDPEDWKHFLADPEKQWRTGYSARTLAYCWHDTDGFPPEVASLFRTTVCAALHNTQPLLVLPEYKVRVPGKGHMSQNDIFVLAKAGDGALVSMMVESKVSEPFGDSVGVWKANGDGFTANKQERLRGLCRFAGLTDVPDAIHYQLLHRTASAMIEAETYNAPYAVMIVHSFSPENAHWKAFDAFVRLYGKTPQIGQLVELTTVGKVRLFAGWAHGHERYLKM